MGALAVTYGVGALSVVNAVAGAYAESSPVVVISGAPGVREQRSDPLIHHRFGPFNVQKEIFERITCATVVLDDPIIALRQIDRALDMARFHSKPVYPRFSISTLLRLHNALNLRDKRRKTVCHRRVTTPPTVFLLFSSIFSTLRTLATRLMENLGLSAIIAIRKCN